LTTDGNSYCKCYTGTCDASGDAASFDVYSIENICYWTSAIPVHTASDCANSAETTMNDGVDASVVTFSANWNEALCHYECQEHQSKNFANTEVVITAPDCLGFSIDSNSGDCNLYYNGACSKSEAGTADTKNYLAMSGFIEIPFITLDTCTHLHEFEQDPVKVAACKEHSDEDTCESEGDCYYLKHASSECFGSEY
jgi:hypothetical protein